MTIANAGIEYKLPIVHLLQHSGLGTSEFAGRTAYDSFDKSENEAIKTLNNSIKDNSVNNFEINTANYIGWK